MLQSLKVWAKTLSLDDIYKNYQRRTLDSEEWEFGWLRNVGLSAPQLNSLFFLLTSHSNPVTCSPYLHLKSKPIPEEALEMGSSITQSEYPALFEYYGATLPDIKGEAPTGFTYIVRKQ